jgi:3-hydroxybutyryl-CoA dehydrogenase
VKIEDIKCIGVLGAGVMGAGISQTAILAGYKVITRDLTDEIIARARENIINGRFGLKDMLERGKITREQMDITLANLTLTTKVEDLKNCDLVIETIGGGPSGQVENKDIKLKVFAELDKTVKKTAIFASNTSKFTIADLAAVTGRKPLFIGMHWFSPANVMKIIEVVWTPDTSEETIQTIEALSEQFGKQHVRVKDVPGDMAHVGYRVLFAAQEEARKIVEQGICTAEGVDIIMMGGFNWPSGPIAMSMNNRTNRGQKK